MTTRLPLSLCIFLSQLEVALKDVASAAVHRHTIRRRCAVRGGQRAVIRRRFSHPFLFRAVSHKS